MLYFTADKKDANQLLNLGAVWDNELCRWRVESFSDYKKFAKWINGKIITDELYILEAEDICPFCNSPVKLAAIACGEYSEDFLPVKFGTDCVNFLYGFENVSSPLAKILRERFSIKERYVPSYGYKYLVNGCNCCGKAFPDEYLFADVSSPFYINEEKCAQKLKVYSIPLGFDVALEGKIAFSFEKSLFSGCKKEVLKDINFFASK